MGRGTVSTVDIAAEVYGQSAISSGLRSQCVGGAGDWFGLGDRAPLPRRGGKRRRRCAVFVGNQTDEIERRGRAGRQCCLPGRFGAVEKYPGDDKLLGVPGGLLLEYVVTG